MASGLSACAHSKVLESGELFPERGIDDTSVDNTLTQAGTAARWERHGIGAQGLAMHLLDTSAGLKSATGNLFDYKRWMAIAIRIGGDGGKRSGQREPATAKRVPDTAPE